MLFEVIKPSWNKILWLLPQKYLKFNKIAVLTFVQPSMGGFRRIYKRGLAARRFVAL